MCLSLFSQSQKNRYDADVRTQMEAKRDEIDAIEKELEKALTALHEKPEVKVVEEKLNALLCA